MAGQTAELGTAYISVVPDTGGLAKGIKEALEQSEKNAPKTGNAIGQGLTAGINKTLKAGVVGVGVAAGGVLAGSIAKGLGRLQGIDNAKAKLSGLGHEAKAVSGIMDDALASVRGTAFGLEDAATIAASGVAAGIKPGEDLQRTLKLTADAATIAGTDLSSMGSIINKVATSDMMQMDVANQLMDAGIPILQMVADEMGVTADEARKMASAGEISFETFQNALDEGLGGAALKSGETVQGAFANMGAAMGRFGAKLAEPVFNAAPAVFGAVGDAFDTLGEKLEPLIEDFAEWLAPRMEDFAENTIPKLVDGVMEAVDAFMEFGDWVQDNAEWIEPLVAGIGGAVAAIYAWNTATTIAKGVQAAFNLVLAANPIMLVAIAISALVAGLVYFFTQTETGQRIWEKFTTALSDGWNAAVDGLKDGWAWVEENLLFTWEDAVEGMAESWEYTTGVISSAWEDTVGAVSGAWEQLKTGVHEAFERASQRLSDKWSEITTTVSSAWTTLKDALVGAWNTIKSSVFDAWNSVVEGVKSTWEKVTTAISDRWTWLKDQMNKVWSWIRENVFDKIGEGLDTLEGWFQTGVDGIAKIWDGLKAAAAKPVRFVVDTVWNNGILAAWNAISEFLPGIGAKDTIPLGDLGGYASGGVLPGYTPGRDVHEFYSPTGGRIHLSGGEAIMRPEWTRAVGGPGAVERMNRDAKTGKLRNASGHGPSGLWDLGGFAGGGVIGAMMNIVRAKYGNILTMTSGLRPGGGLHGAGLATDWSNGGGNTPEQLALAHDIAQTYPGSAELIYDSPGWAGNIKNGQNVGPFGQFYTLAQAGRHDHHVHWGMTTPPTMQFGGGVFEGGNNGGGVGAAIVNWIADKARSIWSSIVDPIKDKIGGKAKDWEGSSFGKIPGAMFTSMVDAAWSRLSSLFGSGGGSGSGSVDTSNVPGDVVGAVETVFARHGFTGAEWEAAKWIIQKESGWSPTAQNPSSGAYGLFQFNPMGGNTLGAYLPDRNTDPAVQADAGARYIKDRYGTPSAAKRFWEQNQWYANGGVIPSGMGLFDTGGVWKPGTMGLNLSGKNEYVFTNRAMRDFQQATESLQEVAKELGTAFNGGDWGYGELSRYVGEDIARDLVNESANLGIAKVEIDEASKGRDWGYGALSRYVGEDIAHAIVNEASWLGGAKDEVVAAFKGIDFGLASVARYLGGNEDLARDLLDEVSWIGGAVDEVSAAWQGIDFGLASVARYLGGNERLAIGLLNGVESLGTVAKEIGDAFGGGDWGTGEMERYIGSGAARVVFDAARAAGSFIRREHDDYIQAKYGDFGNLARSLEVIAAGGPTAWGEAASDVINTALTGAFDGSKWLHEDSPLVIAALHIGNTLNQWQEQWAQSQLNSELRKSAEDYAMEQGSSLLSPMGLEGVIPLAQKVGARVWDAYHAQPVEPANSSPTVVEVEATGGDFVHVDDLEAVNDRVDGLEVKVNRKPAAATVTRGGAL